MSYTRPGSNFLYDETTHDIVGIKDRDGGENLSLVSGGGNEPPAPIQLTASRALVESDDGAVLYYAGTADIAMTVNAALGDGFGCAVVQQSVGRVKFLQGTASIANPATTTTGRNSCVGVVQVGADAYSLVTAPATPATFVGKNGSSLATWAPAGGGSTSLVALGIGGITALGTATARNSAAGSVATLASRIGYVSSAPAGNFAGTYHTNGLMFSVGPTTPPNGGFEFLQRFVPSDAATVAGARMFIGLSGSISAPANVEPNTLTNCIGVAQLSTSENLHIVYGGSAPQTAIDLGSGFNAAGASNALFELQITALQGADTLDYRVTNHVTGAVAAGVITAATSGVELPLSSQLLVPRAWRCNNATALAVGLDLCPYEIRH